MKPASAKDILARIQDDLATLRDRSAQAYRGCRKRLDQELPDSSWNLRLGKTRVDWQALTVLQDQFVNGRVGSPEWIKSLGELLDEYSPAIPDSGKEGK